MSVRSILLSLGALLGACVSAKDQYVFKPTAAASSAIALAGGHGYTYVGCWNETVGFRSNDGARALGGGKSVRELSI